MNRDECFFAIEVNAGEHLVGLFDDFEYFADVGAVVDDVIAKEGDGSGFTGMLVKGGFFEPYLLLYELLGSFFGVDAFELNEYFLGCFEAGAFDKVREEFFFLYFDEKGFEVLEGGCLAEFMAQYEFAINAEGGYEFTDADVVGHRCL